MKTKLAKTLEAVWYAAGPAQYLMYGIWTVAISGLFQLEGAYQLLATLWKFIGAAVFFVTIWGSLKQKMLLILLGTLNAIAVGIVVTSKAVMFGDSDIIRATTQSHYMSIFVIVVWGFYLANLCSRQMFEFKRAGIDE